MSDDKAMQEYLAALLPFQREAIAMAQLAGCEFRPVEKMRRGYKNRLLMLYEAFLPDGEYVGLYDDVYEAAVACLAHLNQQNDSQECEEAKPTDSLFVLLPGNERP